uniref:Core shell protein Gag P30 domain-containing protein n=1 Tax=Macaca mulatta TaxID=9544 RepID=A0A5F7ZPK0_MACMU
MGEAQSKPTPLGTMLKNFKKGLKGYYGVTMTPGKLRTLCEIDWPALEVGWSSEGSLGRSFVLKVWHRVTCKSGYPDQFPYIDSWLQLVLNPPQWLRGQEAAVLVAKGLLVKEGPHSTCLGMLAPKVLSDLTPEESWQEPVAAIPPPYREEGLPTPEPTAPPPPPDDHTPRPPRVDKRESEATGETPPLAAHLPPKTGIQMPLREQRHTGVDEDGHMVERRAFMYQPFTSADLLNWKNNTPSYTEKPQALIDLLQTIIQAHNRTWADCHQLLMYLFNTDERRRVLRVATKWLEEHVPTDYQNPQEYIRIQLPGTDTQWDPNEGPDMERLRWYLEALIESLKKGSQKATNVNKVSEVIQGKEESPAQFSERL